MKATPLAISDVLLLEPRVFDDERGAFFESFNARTFAELIGREVAFVQDNQSVSRRGVVRGLHYQVAPAPQGKLVRVLVGAIFDVAVDIRRSSPTFGRHVGEILSAENRRQMWIPEGFAHGFVALRDGTEVLYKTTDFYHRAAERAIRWDDPELAIAWPAEVAPILSAKDAEAPAFRDATPFD
ncbi:MAG TPA: dTDP-4-dehydrorhamnose 3,5-epimerase [Devosia sp.]|nr:dTDP-4-dehydrorhamnose 3,5-epimerase [Devosia sp.]